VNGTSTVAVRVEGGGDEVVAHVSLYALGRFAHRLGVGEELSMVVVAGDERGLLGYDRGKVLTQVMLMLAGGGESSADIEYLRAQPDLLGPVPSGSTVWRTLATIDEATPDYLRQSGAAARATVRRRSSATTGTGPAILDIDAPLVEIHSENQEQTAATFKGSSGSTRCSVSLTSPVQHSPLSSARAAPGPDASAWVVANFGQLPILSEAEVFVVWSFENGVLRKIQSTLFGGSPSLGRRRSL